MLLVLVLVVLMVLVLVLVLLVVVFCAGTELSFCRPRPGRGGMSRGRKLLCAVGTPSPIKTRATQPQ